MLSADVENGADSNCLKPQSSEAERVPVVARIVVVGRGVPPDQDRTQGFIVSSNERNEGIDTSGTTCESSFVFKSIPSWDAVTKMLLPSGVLPLTTMANSYSRICLGRSATGSPLITVARPHSIVRAPVLTHPSGMLVVETPGGKTTVRCPFDAGFGPRLAT